MKFIRSAPRPQPAVGIDVVEVQNPAVPGDDDDVVLLLQAGGTLGDDDLLPPDNDGDQYTLAQPQVLQRHPQMPGGGRYDELHGLRPAPGDAVQGVHHRAFGVLQAPDEPQDKSGGGQLGGHHRLHPGGPGDGGIVLPAGLGHHLGHPRLVGVEGNDEVVLVPVGEGHKGVAGGHPLLGEQLRVGAVPVDDQGVGKFLRQLPAPGFSPLHHLAAHAQPLQLDQQVEGDAPAADDEHVSDAVGLAAQQLEELVDAAGGTRHGHPVPRADEGRAVGDEHLVLPLHGAQQQGQALNLGGQGGQGAARQEVPLLDGEGHQLHPAPGKGVDVGGGGEAQQPGDLDGGGELRVDEHGDAEVALQGVQIADVLGAPHPGHGIGHPQPVADVAAQQVDFVGVGGGDEHVGLLGPRLQQHLPGDAVSFQAHHVQLVGQPVQGIAGHIHNGDAVALVRQMLGQGCPHLAASRDDNGQIKSTRFISIMDGPGEPALHSAAPSHL